MKKKEKKYGLLKAIAFFVIIAIVLSWLIQVGSLTASGYTSENILNRVGLSDLTLIFYHGIQYGIDKIIMLIVIAGLYGVLGRISAYQDIVTSIAKKVEKRKKLFVVIVSVLIAFLTSVLNATLIVLIFVPFIIAILKRMKLDKMTVLASTFGSMIIGVMGATYGTEGLAGFSSYLVSESFNLNSTVLVRFGILAIGLVLFNFLVLSHMNTVLKKKNYEEATEMFPIESLEGAKKTSKVPLIIIGILSFIIIVVGSFNWFGSFGIEIFTKFHTTVSEIKIGETFNVFQSILGTDFGAIGAWDIFTIVPIVFFITVIIGICYRVKLNDFISNYAEGAKRVIKPILCIMGAFMVMVVVYASPYVSTIMNALLTKTDGFNLATMSLAALIANIFHTDMAFSGFMFGEYLAVEYVDYVNPILTIFTSLYGFVQLFIPTSIVLGIGLTTLDVKYGDWLKFIWKFLVGMLICLLVIFILMTTL